MSDLDFEILWERFNKIDQALGIRERSLEELKAHVKMTAELLERRERELQASAAIAVLRGKSLEKSE